MVGFGWQVMERVSEQMESHPVNQLEDPEAVAKISAEIISLEEQVRWWGCFSMVEWWWWCLWVGAFCVEFLLGFVWWGLFGQVVVVVVFVSAAMGGRGCWL